MVIVSPRPCQSAHSRAGTSACSYRERLEAQHKDELRWLTAAAEPAVDHRDEVIREGETEIHCLTVELAASEAKVDVVSEVLSRKNA